MKRAKRTEDAHFHEDWKARYERLKLLYQVSNVIHSTLDSEEALRLILSEAVRLTRASSGSVVLVNPNNNMLEIQATRGLSPDAVDCKLTLGQGITGWVARFGRPLRIGDVKKHPQYVMLRAKARSELAIPVEVNGRVGGVINVDSDRLNAFTEEDQDLLEGLAMQASKVINNTWLYEQLRLKARLFESLVSVSQAINSTFELKDALPVITREACSIMHARLASLFLLDESREWLELKACHGGGQDYLNRPPLSVAESHLGTVVRRNQPLKIMHVPTSSSYQQVELAEREGLISLLSVPLVYHGKVMGALNVYTGEQHQFSNEEIRILSALAELSALAIDKARLFERITEAEEQLRASERLSTLGLLAAEVAHEIRNPLTVMKMLFHSLNLQFSDRDPRARDAEVMSNKMDQLNRIVDKVLDFARSTEPVMTLVDLNGIIDDLRLLTRHKLRDQRVDWVTRLAPRLPQVLADGMQMEQVFLNLILNAVEAMPGGGRLVLRTRAVRRPRSSRHDTHVEVEFRDNGEGMSEEQRKRLFSSLLNTTKESGTGLGLAIVNRLVEAHRGQVKVKSRPGEGTRVTLLLPVAIPEV